MNDRPKAHSYEDGWKIKVNIINGNTSILLTFASRKDYRNFCEEVADLKGVSER